VSRRRRPFQPRRRRERGFTLIELMVALVLFSLVIAGMMAVAVSMITGFRDQEITIATEGATRSTVDFLADAVRNTSPGVPQFDNLVALHAATCPTGAIAIVANAANPAPLTHTSDKLTVTYASGGVVTTATSAFAGTSGATVNVVDATQLAANDYVIFTDFNTGHLVHVSASSGTAPGTITITTPLCTGVAAKLPTSGYISGATVIRATRARFEIGVVDSDDIIGKVPVLTMDIDAEGPLAAEPIAEGIEDLQVVFGADSVTTDGVLSAESTTAGADEWFGNVNGEAVPLILPNSTRAVRISVVARTVRQFTGVNTFRLGALEDRLQNGATDNFRRRILSTTVEVRNLNGSP
jgi:prepilin-type N-terminal cleavage/methylation domain-containing protein